MLLLMMIGASAACAKWWFADYRAALRGEFPERSLPGASPAPRAAIVLATGGALLLLGAETWGEHILGISGEQTRITVLFGLQSLAAAFIEELIFRGYLVVSGRGRVAFVAGIVAASAVFAALHPFLWEWKDGALLWRGGTKAWFSTAAIFTGSLWFYFVRYMPSNPKASLWPCVAAHMAKNLGVFVIKGAQGHVVGWC